MKKNTYNVGIRSPNLHSAHKHKHIHRQIHERTHYINVNIEYPQLVIQNRTRYKTKRKKKKRKFRKTVFSLRLILLLSRFCPELFNLFATHIQLKCKTEHQTEKSVCISILSIWVWCSLRDRWLTVIAIVTYTIV